MNEKTAVIIISTCIVIAICVISILKRKRSKVRADDLHKIWKKLNGEASVFDDIVKLFKEGMHIHEHYGVPFPEGCTDKWHFYGKAYSTINDRIDWLRSEFEKNMRYDQFKSLEKILRSKLEYDIDELEKQLEELSSLVVDW